MDWMLVPLSITVTISCVLALTQLSSNLNPASVLWPHITCGITILFCSIFVQKYSNGLNKTNNCNKWDLPVVNALHKHPSSPWLPFLAGCIDLQAALFVTTLFRWWFLLRDRIIRGCFYCDTTQYYWLSWNDRHLNTFAGFLGYFSNKVTSLIVPTQLPIAFHVRYIMHFQVSNGTLSQRVEILLSISELLLYETSLKNRTINMFPKTPDIKHWKYPRICGSSTGIGF